MRHKPAPVQFACLPGSFFHPFLVSPASHGKGRLSANFRKDGPGSRFPAAGVTGAWIILLLQFFGRGAPGSALAFAGAARLSNTNDYPANTAFGDITFKAGAGAFTLAGNAVGLAGDVINYSANEQTIGLLLSLEATNRAFYASSGNVAVVGAIVQTNAGAALGIVKAGRRTLTLSGDNTYSGLTAIAEGALNVRSGTGLGATNLGTSVAEGGALELQGGIAIGNETLTLAGAGVDGASGALRNVSGDNTYGGAVALVPSEAGARINSDAGVLTLSGRPITGAGSDLIVGGAGDVKIFGIIGTGAGGLAKDGAGTLTLTNANTFAGPLTISGGVVRAGSAAGALGAAGILQFAGGSLELANDAALTPARNTTFVGSDAGITAQRLTPGAGVTFTLGALSIGGQALTINGGGLVNGGTAGVTFGATTFSNAPVFQINNPALGGVTRLTLGAINNGAHTMTLKGSGDFAQTGVLGPGPGGITLAADYSGTSVLNQANTYLGDTIINGGTLRLGTAAGIPSGAGRGNVTVNGTLDLGGYSPTINALSGGGIIDNSIGAGTYTLTMGNNGQGGTFDGVIRNTIGSVALSKIGTNTLTLTGENTYTGLTTIGAGVLNVRSDTGLGATNTGTAVSAGQPWNCRAG